MEQSTATLVFAAIMGSGFLIWSYSLFKALSVGNESPADDPWKPGAEFPGSSTTQFGERTVHGDPEKLSKTLAKALVNVNIGMFGTLFELVERTNKRVVLKKTGPLICNQPAGLYFSEAEFNFEPLGGDAVRVTYQLGYDRLIRLSRRISLLIIFGIGLPLQLIVGAVIWFFVVNNAEPAVRWQVFQCLQIFHAIWPPFLFLSLYSMGRRHSKTFASNILATLELAD